MRNSNRLVAVLAVILVSVGGLFWLRQERRTTPTVQSTASINASPSSTPSPAAAIAAPSGQAAVAPKVVAAPVAPSPLKAFQTWADAFTHAAPADRDAMTTEGLRLAAARSAVMARMIQEDPERAIREALPYAVRSQLPESFKDLIEVPVSGQGDLLVLGIAPSSDKEFPANPIRREVVVNGERYDTFVYGARLHQTTQFGAPINGVALGKTMALSNTGRLLDDAEAAALSKAGLLTSADPVCGVSGKAIATVAAPAWLDVGGRHVALCEAGHAALLNDRFRKGLEALLLASDPGGTNPPVTGASQATISQGTKKVLFMRLTFPDDNRDPIGLNDSYKLMNDVNEYYRTASYDLVQMVPTVTPLIMMPRTAMYYAILGGPAAVLADARVAARDYGFEYTNYDLDVVGHVELPSTGFEWCGLGYVGARGSWIQCFTAKVVSHELGHNLGLLHANASVTTMLQDPTQPPQNPKLPEDTDSHYGHDAVLAHGYFSNPASTAGFDLEYGNPNDWMGRGEGSDSQFSSLMKYQLRWLAPDRVKTITTSGTNRLYAFDTADTLADRLYALRIEKDRDLTSDDHRSYWIDHRYRFPNNPWLAEGVNVYWTPWVGTKGSAQLLDMTPGTPAGREDAGLVIGHTFADTEAQIYITPIAKGGSGPEEYIDVVVNLGPFPANRPPQFTLNASALIVDLGQPITFTASDVVDPDGDTVAFRWDFSDDSFGANQDTVTKRFTEAGEYSVRCEVSDMKGGKVSHHLVVRVGNVTTYKMSGRVVDQDAKPLADVRVAALDAQQQVAFTDSDGRYTITGLTNNSTTNAAFLYGYQTKPLTFDNPTPLAAQSGGRLDHLSRAIPVVSVTAVQDASEASARQGMFRITRTGDTNQSLLVYLGAGGTAAAPDDYAAVPESVVFDPGVSSIDLPIVPVDDTIGEGRETVTIQLLLAASRETYFSYLSNAGTNGIILVTGTNTTDLPGWELRNINGTLTWFQADPPYVLGTPLATISLVDNDNAPVPTVSATVFDETALENGEDSAVILFSRDVGLDLPLTITYSVGGSASNGVDYVKLSGSLTFPSGVSVVPLNIRSLDDLYVEGDETIEITVQASPSYNTDGKPVVVTIIDNDLPTVTVNAEVAAISELLTNVPGVFVFSRAGDITKDLQVNYLLRGTATNGLDYGTLSGRIVIPAGQDQARLQVFGLRDRVTEPKETIELLISSSSAYNPSTPSSATITIFDTSMPLVSLDFGPVFSPTINIDEAGGSLSFDVVRSGPSLPAMSVPYTFGGGADSGGDYSALSGVAYFAAGVSNVTINIRPFDDTYPENYNTSEAIHFRLLPGDNYALIQPYQLEVLIDDNDTSGQIEVSFDSTEASTSEAVGSYSVALRTSGIPQPDKTPVIVEFEVVGGSAVLGKDYSFTDYPGMNRGWAAFNFYPTNGTTWVLLTNLNLTILDNTNADGDKTIVLGLKYPELIYTNVTQITNSDGKPGNATNYLIYPTNFSLGAKRYYVLNLKDDDYNTLSVSTTRSNALEQGEVAGQFAFTRVGATDKPVTVRFQVTGTATPQIDYQPLPSQITIPAGSSVAYLNVKPIDDATAEPLEAVTVTLLGADQCKLDTTASQASVTIYDNDGSIEFTSTSYTFGEKAGSVQIPLRRTGDTTLSQSVTYQITGGTATPENDYLAAAQGVVEFLPGETSKNIAIEIRDDTLLETDETIEFEIVGRSGGVPVSGQAKTTVVIQSDDSGFIFSTNSYSVNEFTASFAVNVLRVGSLSGSNGVTFIATNGTAISEQDFRGINRVLRFADGQSNQAVAISVIDNAILDGDKTINLSLSDPGDGASVSDASLAVGLIRDDECTLGFTVSDLSISENRGTAKLTVTRQGGTQHALTVQYATVDGTAVNGTDYTAQSGNLVFRGDRSVIQTNGVQQTIRVPGDTSLTVEIPILDNTIGDGTRRFTVTLSNPKATDFSASKPSPVVLGTNAAVTVTILDNESAGGTDGEFATDLRITDPVNAVVFQPDGRVVFGGDFTEVNDFTLQHIARLTPQGSLDTGFNPGVGSDGTVLALASQADGKVILAGTFGRVGGQIRLGIARINSEGDLDGSFDPGLGANGAIRALALVEGGSVVVGGDFTRFDGQARNRLVRLDESGFVDPLFGASVDGSVNALAVQQDGKILLGGSFTTVSGTRVRSLARLNADGTLDKSFLAGNSITGVVYAITVQPDGGIVVGGSINLLNAATPANLVRFSTVGDLDPSFAIGSGPNGTVRALGVHPSSGKIYVGGDFTSIDGQSRNRFARLRVDGGVDDQYVIGSGADAPVRAVAVQNSSAAIIGGEFSTVDGNVRPRLARIHGDEKASLVGVEFATGLISVDEGVGTVTVTVRRNGDATIPFTAHYITVASKSTASAGTDYVPTNGTLTFGAGVLSQTFQVTILQDTLAEATETVALALDQASPGVDLGGLASSVILIQDDEVSVAFASAVYSVNEGSNAVQVTLVRQGRVNNPASVRVTTANGTAIAGQDYTAFSNVVSFAANETNKTVSIGILEDTLREDQETFTVNLSSPSEGLQLGLATTTVRITDNDTDKIAVAASALVADGNNNGVIDPGETITLSVALRNLGTADATAVKATLLATNNVIPKSEAQDYGLLVGGGQPVSRSFTLSNSGVAGGNITLVFQLADGTRDIGQVSLTLSLGAQTRSFINSSQIVINPVGPASPYPSVISVAGLSGAPTKVTVTLDGLSHTAPGDIDILLVAPNGDATVIMSDTGASKPVDGLVITLDDDAATALPDLDQLTSGTFRPVNYLVNDRFDAPAPQGVITKSNLKFPNIDPNGDWKLFVFDDTAGDSGIISKGWKLNIITSGQVVPVTDVGVSVSQSPATVAPGANETYTLHVANNGPAVANDIKVRQTLPSQATFVSATGGATVSNGVVNATIASLAVGATADIQVVVKFSTLGQFSGTASVTLAQSDYYADNNSSAITTVVQSAEPVLLQVSRIDGAVVVSWPAASQGRLESASSLAGPWSAVAGSPVQNGATLQFTLQPSAAAQFYRLATVTAQ